MFSAEDIMQEFREAGEVSERRLFVEFLKAGSFRIFGGAISEEEWIRRRKVALEWYHNNKVLKTYSALCFKCGEKPRHTTPSRKAAGRAPEGLCTDCRNAKRRAKCTVSKGEIK